jgi:hypothetical protein
LFHVAGRIIPCPYVYYYCVRYMFTGIVFIHAGMGKFEIRDQWKKKGDGDEDREDCLQNLKKEVKEKNDMHVEGEKDKDGNRWLLRP